MTAVVETDHARQRRAERSIDKKDLEAALKYGVKGPCRYGHKFVYRGLCYVVRKEIDKWKEITCYADAVELTKVPVPVNIEVVYNSAMTRLKDHSTWKSNTVVVVDTSGSMKNSDVWGARSRLQAVWLCLALDFVAHRIESGDAGPYDVVSVVLLGEDAKVLVKNEPTTWKLYNKLVEIYNQGYDGQHDMALTAKGHGNYVPSLELATDILNENPSSSCALALCWMSDGKPSDKGEARKQILPSVESLAQRFGRRLSLSAIAIGDDAKEFKMLHSMVDVASDFGVQASFVLPSMTTAGLGVSVTATATSLTKTQTEMTDVSTLKQKNVKHVLRESRTKANTEVVSSVSSDDYWLYPVKKVVRESYEVWYDDDRRRHSQYKEVSLQSPLTRYVALHKKAFGEGAERYAFRFFEVGEDLRVVSKPLVAKESRLVLDGGEEERNKFVKTFCEAQQLARSIADRFNKRLDELHRIDDRTPRVAFLDCSIYELDDVNQGKQKVLVEEKIDHLKWHKWNKNDGYVEGMAEAPEFCHDRMQSALDHLSQVESSPAAEEAAAPGGLLGDLGAITECDDEEEDSEEENSDEVGTNTLRNTGKNGRVIDPIAFTASEVAQAFSHFSYITSGRKRLICDLQGVFDESSNTLKFSDPVIHYFNTRRQDRRGVHGRTDRGRKGMAMFFDTHKECCGHLCKLVNGGFRKSRKPARK